MKLSTTDAAELDRIISQQQRVVNAHRFGACAGLAPGAASDAGKVLQQLLIWQQTAEHER